MRILLLSALLALGAISPLAAQAQDRRPAISADPSPLEMGDGSATVAESNSGVLLAFRLKISTPVGDKVRSVEVAPRMVIGDGKEGQIRVETPDKSFITLRVLPTTGPKGYVTVAMTITARLGGADVTRKVKLTTLLGSPALVEIDDERQKEKLTIEVTPSLSPGGS